MMIPKKTLVMDIECYQNYFLVAFKNVLDNRFRCFEMYEGQDLDRATIRSILKACKIVTFNGNHYDIPVLTVVLCGGDNTKAKKVSDFIIKNNEKPWGVERAFNVKIPKTLDHIDLFEVVPGKASLKAYGGRMHVEKLQDLPVSPDELITDDQRELLKTYCINDLSITQKLYDKLAQQIALREKMSIEYGEDLRSKSDAQVAEAVIKSSLQKRSGIKPERPQVTMGETFLYKPPRFLSFSSRVMLDVFEKVIASRFSISSSGYVLLPKELGEHTINIGSSSYQMGIGGLHSTESSVAHVADENTFILDKDVTSYYPTIILLCRLYPKHLGINFLDVYQSIVNRRLVAKKAGDTVVSDSLKITINGSFGKFGSMWSTLYSPDLLIQTTITGQLALLMLIEMLEEFGISVVSANTDGVVLKGLRKNLPILDKVVKIWEKETGFETEGDFYRAIYCRDVNNYIALKEGKGVKLKGAFAPPSFQKNPTNEICTDAVIQLLKDGTPIEQTILNCKDITKFVTTRNVKGGALKNGEYLGKNVRWYYAKGEEGFIAYKVNGYKVARSEGAKPAMILPDKIPSDIDLEWYIGEADSLLKDVGFNQNLGE